MVAAAGHRIDTVAFWDQYAKWYKLWIEHTHYHEKILGVLLAMARPGWKVLDIGAGNGILSLPLHVRGCEVIALEPSSGMRNLLSEKMVEKKVDALPVDGRVWEEISCHDYGDYDLFIACNTLHVTGIGFGEALAKTFRLRPKNIFLVVEPNDSYPSVRTSFGEYSLLFRTFYETDNSYAYHHFQEVVEHWTFMKGRSPEPQEMEELQKRIVLRDGHLWLRDRARIMMCWWKRNR
ncbi:MAG: class I SAM-dependent methyltransferase [Desulfobacterota bacterium]|nr:class I SAM-dependent methyltransferase [Thermodesulfobacteriota bacterium]